MTYINVSTEQAEVIITEASGAVTAVTTTSAPSVVTAVTAGPQGPPGANLAVVTSSPETGSIVYYDSAVGIFRVDNAHTFTTLADGGNF